MPLQPPGTVPPLPADGFLDLDRLLVIARCRELQPQLAAERPGNALQRVPTRGAHITLFARQVTGRSTMPASDSREPATSSWRSSDRRLPSDPSAFGRTRR